MFVCEPKWINALLCILNSDIQFIFDKYNFIIIYNNAVKYNFINIKDGEKKKQVFN